MPKIPLQVNRDSDSAVVLARAPDGSSTTIASLRLFCQLVVGRDRKAHQAVVDTGAPTTVFPFLVWQRFQADIRWLPFLDGASTKPASLAGRSFRYRLGSVPVRLLGRDEEPTLPPVDVVAQFEQLDPLNETPLELKHTLVGLQLGSLEGRYLVVGPRRDLAERCEAWIADERPVDPLVLASATL
jgi:hypothetical protein